MLSIEHSLKNQGYSYIACIDEVGRGCLAGNVTACAIILPLEEPIDGVTDSKKISANKREQLYEKILNQSYAIGLGSASPSEIDRYNIKVATHLAMSRAVDNLKTKELINIKPDFLLIDAETIPVKIPQKGIIKGDALCHGIAAASIVAKVLRDQEMMHYHRIYPNYDFCNNMGYGTSKHIEALKEIGPCKIHRQSFIRKILDHNQQLNLF